MPGFTFIGGTEGTWRVERIDIVTGAGMPPVGHIDVQTGLLTEPPSGGWMLRGMTSNERYVHRAEREQLVAKQEGLGRPGSTRAALIPIRKNPLWWDMTQDERRAIFETRSMHIAIGLDYLPGIARRLHHCRDLGEEFDFLTWFEYGPDDEPAFDHMVARLRATEEWKYVDREIDIRLSRISHPQS